MIVAFPDRPQAAQRPWNPQPGRLDTRQRLQKSVAIQALERDWLWQHVGPEGKRRLLQEHGLIDAH